jgi:hypothetical protein
VTLQEALQRLSSAPELRDSILDVKNGSATLKRNAVEAFLSYMEGKAEPAVHRMLEEGPPAVGGDHEMDRFYIAALVSLQHVRGESFREQFDQVSRAFLRLQMERSDYSAPEPGHGRTGGPPSLDDEMQLALDELENLSIGTTHKLGLMLPLALENVAPLLFAARWQVLHYAEPEVVGSDENLYSARSKGYFATD